MSNNLIDKLDKEFVFDSFIPGSVLTFAFFILSNKTSIIDTTNTTFLFMFIVAAIVVSRTHTYLVHMIIIRWLYNRLILPKFIAKIDKTKIEPRYIANRALFFANMISPSFLLCFHIVTLTNDPFFHPGLFLYLVPILFFGLGLYSQYQFLTNKNKEDPPTLICPCCKQKIAPD